MQGTRDEHRLRRANIFCPFFFLFSPVRSFNIYSRGDICKEKLRLFVVIDFIAPRGGIKKNAESAKWRSAARIVGRV